MNLCPEWYTYAADAKEALLHYFLSVGGARLNNLNKWGRNIIYMKDSYEFSDYLDKSGTFIIPKLVNLIIF